MEKHENPAIVVGGGSLTGLGAVRSLGRAGVDVYYIDNEMSITKRSKYCKKYFISSKISQSKEELKDVLVKIRDQIEDPAVLFPASDLYALYLSDLMDELRSYLIVAPKKEVIDILINKKKFHQSLRKEKIPTPDTRFPQDLEDVKNICNEISYPTFIKPSLSHIFCQWFGGGRKGFVANSAEELIRHCKLLMRIGIDVMIQEIINGPPNNGVFLDGYMDRKSNLKVLFARRRHRMWPLDFGNSTLCVSIPMSEVACLKGSLVRYLKSINYCGIFSAEFKRDKRDNDYKLLEINSRTSAWFNTLSARCGSNIMLTAYLDSIGRDTAYLEAYEAGVRLMFIRDDIRSSAKMLMNGDISVRELISSLSGKKEYMPYARDDPIPFVIDLSHIVRTIMKGMR